MRVAVPAETAEGERRVALVPDVLSKLTSAGFEVVVQAGAGAGSFVTDEQYRQAGARVHDGDVLAGAGVVLSVQPLPAGQISRLGAGAVTISFLPVGQRLDLVGALREQGVTSFSLELLPRISRAQMMDALSSQALVAGYRAALVAAERLPRFFPMFMTAAGTVAPARVLVLGVGVAGLQAISTARRLGAVVAAYDVRTAAAEEARSVGARFVDLGLPALDGAGGYAREMTEDRARMQRDLLAPHVADADALITTAAVPGRQAPLLVTRQMVEGMRPGSVVVDLAAESGGNCELSRPGVQAWHGQVLVWGGRNVPSELPAHASQLYARNVVNLLLLMAPDGKLAPDFDDEILAGCCVTHAGNVVHAPTAKLMGPPQVPAGSPGAPPAAGDQR
jgi:H+-translocating NAD(P) transhydrogenase subunit alpha